MKVFEKTVADRLNRRTMAVLPIDSLSLTNGTQIRVAVDEATVARYAALMETEEGRSKFPAIIVYRDTDGNLWIADGHHRIMAAIRCKLTEILVAIKEGSKADALWAAAEINGKNALQLKDDDMRKAITMLLEAWPDRSTTLIAEVVGCTHQYVSKVKNQVATSCNLPVYPPDQPAKVVGKDGKSYPARKAAAKKQTSPSKENEPGKTETKDSSIPEPPVSVQQADGTNSNESPASEITEQCSSSPDLNSVSQYDQKLMSLLPLKKDREKGSQPDNIIHVPLSDSDRLVACLFESFDTQFRENVLDTFTRAMLVNDGKESVLKIIAPLYDDIRKL